MCGRAGNNVRWLETSNCINSSVVWLRLRSFQSRTNSRYSQQCTSVHGSWSMKPDLDGTTRYHICGWRSLFADCDTSSSSYACVVTVVRVARRVCGPSGPTHTPPPVPGHSKPSTYIPGRVWARFEQNVRPVLVSCTLLISSVETYIIVRHAWLTPIMSILYTQRVRRDK